MKSCLARRTTLAYGVYSVTTENIAMTRKGLFRFQVLLIAALIFPATSVTAELQADGLVYFYFCAEIGRI